MTVEKRIQWGDLPSPLTAAIEKRTGPIRAGRAVTAGQNSPLAAVVETRDGRVFVKGLPSGHRLVVTQAREATAARLAKGISPDVLWQFDEAGWNVLGFDHIRGRATDYSPGSPDIDLKFLYEWTAGPFAARLQSGASVPGGARMFRLGPGDVILVDEAGMAGTFALDHLIALAAKRGAVVRLLGDDRQLPAVDAGGALRLVAAEAGTPELTTLYRFRDPAEATATLKLRTRDPDAIDWYHDHDRIRGGSHRAMTQAAFDGWKADMLAGKVTLMATLSSTDVTALAARARADRVTAGQVEPNGTRLRDGNLAAAS